MSFDQGDIVILELPFSDLQGSKKRPVLVVSNNRFNSTGLDIIVSKITGSTYNTKLEFKLDQHLLQSGKMKKESYIDVGFLMTIEKSLISGKIGKINKKFLSEIKTKIISLIS